MLAQGKKKIAVIGAGPAGLAAAYKLVQQGHEVDIFEASPYVGGLSRSFELWGYTVDLGPHRFFSGNEDVNRFWFDQVGSQFSWVRRQTRIFYKERFFDYPLQPLNTLRNLGIKESLASVASYIYKK